MYHFPAKHCSYVAARLICEFCHILRFGASFLSVKWCLLCCLNLPAWNSAAEKDSSAAFATETVDCCHPDYMLLDPHMFGSSRSANKVTKIGRGRQYNLNSQVVHCAWISHIDLSKRKTYFHIRKYRITFFSSFMSMASYCGSGTRPLCVNLEDYESLAYQVLKHKRMLTSSN